MRIPNEIAQIIIGYLEESPEYMNARQINRSFRLICRSENLEAKFTKIVNSRFGLTISPQKLFTNKSRLLLLRLRPAEGLERNNRRKTLYYHWPFPALMPEGIVLHSGRDSHSIVGDCFWGLLIEPGTYDGYYYHIDERVKYMSPVRGKMAIFRTLDIDSYQCLFSMDISVPDGHLCDSRLSTWDEHETSAAIPYKYIILESSDEESYCYSTQILARIIDVWNNKRFDLYLSWDKEPPGPQSMFFFEDGRVTMIYSKFGVLIVGCWRHRHKFLVVGHAQYLGNCSADATAADMSRLLEYFQYILEANLTTLVCVRTESSQPLYYPLTEENWFGSDSHIFRIPSQNNVPTYREYFQFASLRFEEPARSQSRHISVSFDVPKNHPVVSPDFELAPKGYRSARPVYDHTFAVCKGAYRAKILDLRPPSLKFALQNKKIKALKCFLLHLYTEATEDGQVTVVPSSGYDSARFTLDFLRHF